MHRTAVTLLPSDAPPERTYPRDLPSGRAPATAATSTPALPDLLTPAEVAAWLRTSRKAIYTRAERGALPGAVRLGGRLFFQRTALLRWLEQGRVPHGG